MDSLRTALHSRLAGYPLCTEAALETLSAALLTSKQLEESNAEEPSSSPSELGNLLRRLAPRWFLVRNAQASSKLALLMPRWAMSYLRGPMTPSELRLALGKPVVAIGPATPAAPSLAPPASPAVPVRHPGHAAHYVDASGYAMRSFRSPPPRTPEWKFVRLVEALRDYAVAPKRLASVYWSRILDSVDDLDCALDPDQYSWCKHR